MTIDEKQEMLRKLDHDARVISDDAEREKFYHDRILPLIKDVFMERYADTQTYDYLILSVGESIEPVILSINALKPKHILFLASPKTEERVQLIKKAVADVQVSIDTSIIDKDNPIPLYEAVKEWFIGQGRPSNCAIDGTGGTKVMAMGCALAASILQMDIYYIASNYNPFTRKPHSGSEELIKIANPYDVLGDFERQKAYEYFNLFAYEKAAQIFEKLYDMTGIQDDHLMARISLGYSAWESLNFESALVEMEKAQQILNHILIRGKTTETGWGKSELERLSWQLKWLSGFSQSLENRKDPSEFIASDYSEAMLLFLFENALRREAAGHFEMASLLMYRVTEMIMQIRLYKGYQLLTDSPDYSLLGMENETLETEVNKIYRKIFEKRYTPTVLPDKVSQLIGYALLAVAKDPLFFEKEAKPGDGGMAVLRKLQFKMEKRNYSILAHGFQTVSKKDFYEVKDITENLLTAYFKGRADYEILRQTAIFLKV